MIFFKHSLYLLPFFYTTISSTELSFTNNEEINTHLKQNSQEISTHSKLSSITKEKTNESNPYFETDQSLLKMNQYLISYLNENIIPESKSLMDNPAIDKILNAPSNVSYNFFRKDKNEVTIMEVHSEGNYSIFKFGAFEFFLKQKFIKLPESTLKN